MMKDIWSWLTKAVSASLTPRRLIMFGLVFLFAFRRGVFRIIRNHLFPLSKYPAKKDIIQKEESLPKPNDQEVEVYSDETKSSKVDQKRVIRGSNNKRRRSFDRSYCGTPSTITNAGIIITEDLPTSKDSYTTRSDSKKTVTSKAEVNEKSINTAQTKAGDMPPKRKRKVSRDDTKSKKIKEDCKARTLHSCSAEDDLSKPFSLRKCRSWFLQYAAQDDPETIGPDGIERLCQDLAVDPENVVMLVVAWKLQAETLGFFKFTEWSKGMGNLECDSTEKLQARLGSLSTILRDNPTFKKIYRYAFDFCRNPDQRTLDIDTATAMLKVLLKGKWSLIDSFLVFMQQSKYKVINRDQWCNVLEFSRSISTDLSNYDEDGAWPVLMDEFVEWYRTKYHNAETST